MTTGDGVPIGVGWLVLRRRVAKSRRRLAKCAAASVTPALGHAGALSHVPEAE